MNLWLLVYTKEHNALSITSELPFVSQIYLNYYSCFQINTGISDWRGPHSRYYILMAMFKCPIKILWYILPCLAAGVKDYSKSLVIVFSRSYVLEHLYINLNLEIVMFKYLSESNFKWAFYPYLGNSIIDYDERVNLSMLNVFLSSWYTALLGIEFLHILYEWHSPSEIRCTSPVMDLRKAHQYS